MHMSDKQASGLETARIFVYIAEEEESEAYLTRKQISDIRGKSRDRREGSGSIVITAKDISILFNTYYQLIIRISICISLTKKEMTT